MWVSNGGGILVDILSFSRRKFKGAVYLILFVTAEHMMLAVDDSYVRLRSGKTMVVIPEIEIWSVLPQQTLRCDLASRLLHLRLILRIGTLPKCFFLSSLLSTTQNVLISSETPISGPLVRWRRLRYVRSRGLNVTTNLICRTIGIHQLNGLNTVNKISVLLYVSFIQIFVWCVTVQILTCCWFVDGRFV